MHPAWAWATEHWFLTFVLALSALNVLKALVKGLTAPFARPQPTAPPAPQERQEETEEEEEPEVLEEVEVEPIRRAKSRFDRL